MQLIAKNGWASGWGGWSWDVVGPGSAVNNSIATFDWTTGKLIKSNALAVIDSFGKLWIWTITPSAQAEFVSWTEQLRLTYDSTNYSRFKVWSTWEFYIENVWTSAWTRVVSYSTDVTLDTVLSVAKTTQDTTSQSWQTLRGIITHLQIADSQDHWVININDVAFTKSGTGNVTALNGSIVNIPLAASGTISSANWYAVYLSSDHASHTITTATWYNASVINNAGTIWTAYGYVVSSLDATTAYGFYNNQTDTTNVLTRTEFLWGTITDWFNANIIGATMSVTNAADVTGQINTGVYASLTVDGVHDHTNSLYLWSVYEVIIDSDSAGTMTVWASQSSVQYTGEGTLWTAFWYLCNIVNNNTAWSIATAVWFGSEIANDAWTGVTSGRNFRVLANAATTAYWFFNDIIWVTNVLTQTHIVSEQSIRFFESTDTNYTGIKASATLATDWILTLPTTAGTSGYVLSTDGSWVTSWIAAWGWSWDVTKVGTPVDNQIWVWTWDGTIEWVNALQFDWTKLSISGVDSMTVNGSAITTHLQVHETDASGLAETALEIHKHTATAWAWASMYFARSRWTTWAESVVQSGDALALITWVWYDWTDYATAAQISFEVDGTPGSNDMPGRIVFSTSADGWQTLTERLRISQNWQVWFTGTAVPISNDGAALGTTTLSFSDLFLASGAVINFANGDAVLTHSTGILTVSTWDLRVTTAGTNTSSVVTVGGTQTLTSKTLTSPVINVTSDATGDIYYRNSWWAFTRLGIWSTDNVLKVSWWLPARWAASWGWFWTTVPWTPTRSSDTVFTITDTSNANLYDQLLQRWTIIKRTQSGTKQAMVVSATYATNTVTVTLIWDTFAAGFSDVKYWLEKARMYKFAIAGTIGTTGTNLANTVMVESPTKIYWADFWAGTAGSGTTTVDINKGWTTMFTTKPSILTTNQNILWVTADTWTTATTGDYLTLDVDAVAGTTKIIDAYVNLYYMPLYMANLT